MRVSLENKVEIGSREQAENTSTYLPHEIMRADRNDTPEKFKSLLKLVNRKEGQLWMNV
jgi:hypothetical protein